MTYQADPLTGAGESLGVGILSGASVVGGDHAVLAPGSCTQTDPDTVTCPFVTPLFVVFMGAFNDTVYGDAAATAALEAHGGPGDDDLRGTENADRLSGDDGNDSLDARGGDDSLDGGQGDDTFYDGAGNDVVTGGPGNDTWIAGPGSDTFTGGVGNDRADYSARTAPVTLSSDGVANDGEAGEGDNIGTDVEDLIGGSGSDTITGGPQTGLIRGGGGNDTLKAGPAGQERIEGEEGDDVIDTRNGVYDSVDCGPGNDTLYADPGDGATNCEISPDRDGDGYLNGQDCAPDDPAIHPGAPEIYGNGVDENCDGVLGYFTVDMGVTYTYVGTKRPAQARFTSLKAGTIRAGDVIDLRCKGKGCPFARKVLTGRKGTVNLVGLLRKRMLRAGATLEVRVLRTNWIAKVQRLTVSRRGTVSSARLCLPPGAKAPGRCS